MVTLGQQPDSFKGSDILLKFDHLDNDNNNNNDRIEWLSLRFLQSPHCAEDCLQHIGSSGQGPVMCNTSSTYHTQHVMCHVVWMDSSAVKFDRVKIAFILAFNLLTDTINWWKGGRRLGGGWAGGETGVQRKPPDNELQKIPHTKAWNFKPNPRLKPTL